MDTTTAAVLGGLIGGLWLFLLWLGIVIWTFKDVRERSRDLFVQVLSVFLVLMFFPGLNLPGLLLYLLLRPRDTLDEAYARSLEQEVLLREVGEGAVCHQCQQPAEKDFLFCPYCQARLRESCERCRRPVSLFWVVCPYCGAPRGAAQQPAPARASSRVAEEAFAPRGEPAPGSELS
jgi:RNA polymerase subunit RPABC4/transcription elongation factor Spt4